MSIKICAQIWKLELEPTDKLLLLALGDYSNDSGTEIYPGYDSLAEKTGLTKRTIITKIQKLIELGFLTRVSHFTGRGNRQEFSLHLGEQSDTPSPIQLDLGIEIK